MCGRFDVLGLTEERERDGEGKSRAPGLGVYAAWLGGLPGWLSGAPLHPPCPPSMTRIPALCGCVDAAVTHEYSA